MEQRVEFKKEKKASIPGNEHCAHGFASAAAFAIGSEFEWKFGSLVGCRRQVHSDRVRLPMPYARPCLPLQQSAVDE